MSKIAVVDDEMSVCEVLRTLFENAGDEVVIETDAEKAIEMLLRERPDCILLDIKMPKLDGVELLSRIKDLNLEAGVIMITGYGNLESAMESMRLGAFDYVTKPFNLKSIEDTVRRCIAASSK